MIFRLGLRHSAKVDECHGRPGRPDGVPTGIVAECPDVAVRPEPAVTAEPRRTPAEAGEPETLEPLGEWPQLVEPERLGSPGDEVFTHRSR